MNHALNLEYLIGVMKAKIGEQEYNSRFKKTHDMLKSFDIQGCAARYSKQLKVFTDSLGKETRQSAREINKGKTLTALTRGEIAWGDLRKGDGDNITALKLECIARGPMNTSEKLGWTEMKKKVQQHDKEA
jgi:hypothetical protein